MAAARLDDVALDVGAPTAPASKPGVDLEWQTFSSTQLPAAAAPAVAATTSPRPAQPSTAAAAAVAAGQDGDVNPLMCFTPSFWKQSFDVTTADVRSRIRMAAWPLEPTSFLSQVGARVDLYGPIWLCATLVFVIAAGSSLNSFFAFTSSSSSSSSVGGQLASIWKYDFKTITLALMTVYGYFTGAATGAWLGASYLGIPAPSLVQLVCVYGYSVTPFIPAALLCAVPVGAVQWMACLFAGMFSSLFVFKALYPYLRDASVVPPHIARAGVGAVVFAQMAFAVACKLYFFSY